MSMSQQDEPDPGARERQHGRQRRWSRGTKIAAFVVAAAIGLVSLAVIVGTRPGEKAVPKGVAPKVDYMIDLNTGVMTTLPKAIVRSAARRWGPRYAASHDGARLAYVGRGDEASLQIFIAGIDGTGVRQVTHDRRGATSPAWSPDGARIAYTGYGSGDVRNLFVFDVATGESTQVTDEPRDVWGPQFAPDGSSLIFTGGSSSDPVLRTVPVAGGKSTRLIPYERGLPDSGDGSLSPDGSLVTFLGSGTPRSGNPGHCGPCRWVANADGTERRAILGDWGGRILREPGRLTGVGSCARTT